MDTDDLTEMAYESILIANEITDFLRCDFGYLDSWNLLEELDLDDFVKGIEELEKHILKTIKTPIEKRGDPPQYG